MSLYDLMFGKDADDDNLFQLIGFLPRDFGRFRGISTKDNNVIVYTRCGGNNRECYRDVFKLMENHVWFDRVVDDEDDSTYCNFYFSVPDKVFEEYATHLNEGNIPVVCWSKVLDTLEG